MSERHERRRVRYDKAGVLEADDREEKPDAGRNGGFEREGNGVHNGRAYPSQRKCEEEEPLDKYRGKSRLVGDAHPYDDGEREVGVQAHTRCEWKWVIGIERHDERSNGGGHGGGNRDVPRRHARLRENLRVDEQDVRHRKEGRRAGTDLRRHVRAPFGEAKGSVEQFRRHAEDGLTW